MSGMKKMAVIFVIVALILLQVMNPVVKAEELDLGNLFGNEITDNDGNGSDLNVPANNTVENNIPVNNATVDNTPNKNTNNTTLPKTGANENMLIVLISVCVISSIYAYKKVKEYNV